MSLSGLSRVKHFFACSLYTPYNLFTDLSQFLLGPAFIHRSSINLTKDAV